MDESLSNFIRDLLIWLLIIFIAIILKLVKEGRKEWKK